MKRKTNLYLMVLICGILLLTAAAYFWSDIHESVRAILMSVSSILIVSGISMMTVRLREKLDPKYARQNDIDKQDERNTVIRRRAAAVSGSVLTWCLYMEGLAAIAFHAPLWVELALMAPCLLKLLLELGLNAYYGRKM